MSKPQQVLSENTAYDVSLPRAYNGLVSSSLTMQWNYEQVNGSAIKIATEPFSDYSNWSYVNNVSNPGRTKIGSFGPEQLGNNKNTSTYSKNIRFESYHASTNHKLRCDSSVSYPNGFYPSVIHIANHNMQDGDYIIFKAYTSNSFSQVAYKFKIEYHPKEIFAVNFYPFAKYKYYELEFVFQSPRIISIGRAILAGSLSTTEFNNIQEGYSFGFKDYKEEFLTEAKSREYNRTAFVKYLEFEIQVDSEENRNLISEIDYLISKGTGSQQFIIIPNPKDPYWMSICGVLTDFPTYSHEEKNIGTYSFSVEEIE